MNDNTSITNHLESISDRLVRVAELTADDSTRDQLHRLVGDLEAIIECVEETEDAIEDDNADDYMQRLASAMEQRK